MGTPRAEVRRSCITTTVRDESQVTPQGPPVGFELETNGFQFYAIANLDKTSLLKVIQITNRAAKPACMLRRLGTREATNWKAGEGGFPPT